MTKEERTKKQMAYTKERNKKLGLVNMLVYKEDREIIRQLAKSKGMKNADVVKELLEGF
mgnify:FL=1